MTLLLGFVVMFAGWLAPGHFNPWINFQNELLAGIGALLVGFAACGAARGNDVPWPRLAVVMAVAAMVPVLQTLSGQIRFVSDGVLATAYVAGFAMAIVAGAALAHTRRDEFLAGLFITTLAAGLLSTGMAALQWLEVGPIAYVEAIPRGGRPGANLIQANHLATLLGLSLIGALWLFETRRIGGAVLGLCTTWLCLGMVMTRSRTAWLFLVLLALSWLWVRRRAAVRLGASALTIASGLFVAAVIALGLLSRLVDVAAPVSVAERLQSGGGRLRFWQTLLDALWESPWVGYGWAQVSRAAVVGSQHHYTGESMLRNSHNLALDLLLWNGIPLGLLIIGALVWWFAAQVRKCRDSQHWLLLLGTGFIFVHGLLEYPLEYLYFLLTAGLLMGAAEALAPSAPAWRATRAALLAPLVIVSTLTAWVAVEYTRIDEASRQGLMLMAGYARDAAPPQVYLLDGPREYIRLWKTQAHADMKAEELDWMQDVVYRNPSPPAMLRLALATGLNGRLQDATDTLMRLCNMHKPERCDEGRRSWAQLQERYPALRAVTYPAARG